MAEYIKKQHLMDFLDGCIEEEKGNRSQIIVEAIKMTVERMPSADVVERKTGKWIDVDDYIISGSCSACGWQAHLYEDDVVGMNFCPNCGADMRGREDERTE